MASSYLIINYSNGKDVSRSSASVAIEICFLNDVSCSNLHNACNAYMSKLKRNAQNPLYLLSIKESNE